MLATKKMLKHLLTAAFTALGLSLFIYIRRRAGNNSGMTSYALVRNSNMSKIFINSQNMIGSFREGLHLPNNTRPLPRLSQGHDDISNLFTKNHSQFKELLLRSMRLQSWCNKYQKPNITFAQYMDKHNIKLLLPSMAHNLRFAKEYGFVEDAREITEEFLSKLPRDYMMKPTHLSGGNVKINGKSVKLLGKKRNYPRQRANDTTRGYLQKLCAHSLKITYGSVAKEFTYKHIPKKCIFEEQLDIRGVQDYKAWVFNGRVMFVHIDTGRFGFQQKNIRTPKWVEIQDMRISGPESRNGRFKLQEKPPQFWDKLLIHANQIGSRFKHARIDFMVFNNTYVFGEITQCHNGCTSHISPKILEHYYGFLLTHENVASISDPEFVLEILKKNAERERKNA